MRLLAPLLVAVGVLFGVAGPAHAEFGPIELVSKSATEQADVAGAPAISADGRYLAFRGTIGGLTGVFRKNLGTGALEPVAVGPQTPVRPESTAEAPSISADGRYVSFTTKARLDPIDDTNEAADVYVADMGSPILTYELASALDSPGAGCEAGVGVAAPGQPTGLTYANAKGSIAAGRTALSADGRELVFVTEAESNLTSGSSGSTPGVETPAGQVVLRNLASGCTTLVSARRDTETGAMTALPVAGGAVAPFGPFVVTARGGASISADGTTVAWLGAHVPAQAPTLADERQNVDERESEGVITGFGYNEPLWRRVADGPAAPTRRVIGGSDPLAPGCPSNGALTQSACQGSFPALSEGLRVEEACNGRGWALAVTPAPNFTPQLSADGRTVALLGAPTGFTNVFLVDMQAGLTRREALSPLTREVPDPLHACRGNESVQSVAVRGDIYDLAISPSGNRIAFVSGRQQYPQAPPSLIGAPPSAVGLTELYVIDRAGGALQRLTGGPGGTPSLAGTSQLNATNGQGASSPSFTADDGTLAFGSVASNLVVGDANGAGDVFTVTDRPFEATRGSSTISPPPSGVGPPPRRWRISVSASSRPNGSVRLFVSVPGRGVTRATARELPLGGSERRPRSFSAARRRARGEGLVVLDLKPKGRVLRQAREPGGLPATARVAFASSGHRTVRARVQVRFDVHPHRGRGPR